MPYKLKRRGKTVWRGRVRQDGKDIVRHFPTKAKATEWEVMTKASLAEEPPQTPSTSLLAWTNDYLAYAVRYVPKTFSEKRNVFRRLFKALSPDTDVHSVTARTALDYLQAQFRARSGYAANKERKNLGAAWRWGAKYIPGFPTYNPFLAVERFPEERKRRYVPQVRDFEKVLAVAQGQDRVMLLTFLYLAARRGEVYRLRWEDVDFAGERVRIGTRKRQDGSLEYEWIPMAGELYDALLAHRQGSESEWVFVQPQGRFAGKPYTENRGFPQALCEKAGVRPFGCHAIRHLTASILAGHDVPMVVIQSILRHKKLATTERYVRGMAPVRPHLEALRGSSGGTIRGTNEKARRGKLRALSGK